MKLSSKSGFLPAICLIYFLAFNALAIKYSFAGGCTTAPNDDCVNAITLVVNDVCVTGNTCGNIESGESTACSPLANQSVWYSFVATDVNMTVVVENLFTGGCDIGSSVWDGSSGCLPSGLLSCQNILGGPIVQTHPLTGLTVSNTYYVRVEYNRGGMCDQEQTFCIKVSDNIDCVGNNVCGNACPVLLDSTCYSSTLEGAFDDWAGVVGCQDDDNPEVWFTGISTGDTLEFTVDTTGAGFTGDIELIVASGSCFGLSIIGWSCGPAPLNFTLAVTPGTQYWWTVSSSDGENGPGSTFNICVNNTGCPTYKADAGQDAIICALSSYTTLGADTGGGASSIIWTTSGTGTFSDSSVLITTYSPSLADETAGSVTLTITTNDPDGPGPCVAASDSMVLMINQTITIFPYIQNFDAFTPGTPGILLDDWRNVTGDDFDWYVNTGGTSSLNTGPPSDHTTGSGNYMYTESTWPNYPNKIAILVTPCIDISGLTTPFLEFWYHMYGAAMGALNIDIQVIGGPLFLGVDAISGNQDNKWHMREIDLSAYSGVIQIIFRGETGSSFTSDMAIDDVKIYDKPLNDVGVIAINAPNTGCSLSASENVTIRVKNFGAEPQDTIPVSYSIGGPPINDTIFTLIAPGNTESFTFATTADLSATGTYIFDVWTALSTDINNINDSITNYKVDHLTPVITFPYIENFDAFTPGIPGILLNDWLNAEKGDFEWYVNNGTTPTFSTGPTADHTTGVGNYMYTEANGNIPAKIAFLTSPCIDISSLSNPFLEFWYHMYGSWMGTLYIDIESGGVWTQGVDSIVGDQGNNWFEREVDLSAFSGIIRVGFRGVTGAWISSDMAIDDVKIYDKPPNDVGVIFIGDPNSGCGLSASEFVVIEVKNLGLNPQDTIPVSYSVNGGPPVNDTIFVLLNPGNTTVFAFATPADLSTPGTYIFDAWTSLTGDGDNSNDSTAGYRVLHVAPINTFPYIEDFESGTLGGFFNSGGINTLTWVNTGIRGSDPGHSSTRSAYFGNPADTSYNTGYIEGANLTLPCIDLSALDSIQLSFNYFLETENLAPWDDARVSISTDNITYTVIAGNNIIGNLADPSLTWQALTLDISAYGGFPTVYIRFSFNTGDAVFNIFEGFYIDDINITVINTCFILSIDSTNVLCFGDSTGTATVIIDSLGTAPYTYIWSNGQTDSIATGLPAGTYQVKVSDANGCSDSATVTIAQPLAALSVSITDTVYMLCNGNSTDSATVTPAGGTQPYTYLWNTTPVQTDSTATGLPAGTYMVLVTDTNGCTDSANITILPPLSPLFGIYTIGGGSPDYVDFTSAVADLNSRGISAAVTFNVRNGTYTEQITIDSVCGASALNTVTFQSENSDSTLVILTFAANSIDNYTVQLNNADFITFRQMTIVATDITNGRVFVIAGGSSNNKLLNNRIIGVPTSFITNNVALIFSSGGADENNEFRNNVLVDGSHGFYYIVSASESGTVISGNTFTNQYRYGMYLSGLNAPEISSNIISTNSSFNFLGISCNYCDNALIISKNKVTAPTTNGFGILLVNCDGAPGNEGMVSNNFVQIGINDFGYGLYINSSFYQNIYHNSIHITSTDIVKGRALFTTSSGGNLNIVNNIFMNSGGGYAVYIGTPTAIAAMDYNDLYTAGTYIGNWGGSDYTTLTQWQDSTLQDSNSISVDPLFNSITDLHANSPILDDAGTDLSSVVTDDIDGETRPAAPCIGADEFIIGCALSASITDSSNVLCNGDSTGSATVTPAGGTQPYTYLWNTSPAQTDSTATGLPAGTYQIIVNDINACVDSTTVIITEPLAIPFTMISDTICDNDSIFLQNAWQDTAGTYYDTSLTVNGCDSVIITTLTVDTIPTVNIGIDNTYCDSIELDAGSGGFDSYLWNTGDTTRYLTVFVSGTYFVTITKDNCEASDTITITLSALFVSITDSANVPCNGDSTGFATVTPGGGTQPYTYLWNTSPAQTDSTATGLPTGTYIVLVTDTNGCSDTATITITEPPFALTASIVTNSVSCAGICDATGIANTSGGTPPYTYLWSNGDTAATTNSLCAGLQNILISDSNGCTETDSFLIISPVPISTETDSSDVTCNGACNGTATVTASNGTPPYTYLWNDPLSQTTPTADSLCADTFEVLVTDSNGCTAIDSIIIIEPVSMGLLFSPVQPTCNGDCDGYVTVTPSGGTPPYSYLWMDSIFNPLSPPQTDSTATGLCSGLYNVDITDSNSCVNTTGVIITDPTPLITSITGNDAACGGVCDGDATIFSSGGALPYTYLWNDPDSQTTPTATGLCAATFIVTVTDANGCSVPDTVTISEPPVLGVFITSATNPSCFGFCDGINNASASGGTTPYTYSWNTTPVQTDSTATGLCAGSYVITVTDSNGCIASKANALVDPPPIILSISGKDSICSGICDGSILASASGGVSPYTYLIWSNTFIQTGSFADSLCADTFYVLVNDSMGCLSTDSVIIYELPPENPTFFYTDTAYCQNGPNPIPTVTGFIPGTFSSTGLVINNTTGTIDLAASNLGSYIITYTTGGPCSNSSTFAITILSTPDATIDSAGPFCGDGSPINLSAADAGGTWSGTGITDSIAGTFAPLTAGPGTHPITYTVSNANCSDLDTIFILVLQIPSLSISGDTTICEGSNTTFALNFTGEGPFNIEYTDGNITYTDTNLSTGDAITFSPAVTTTYTLLSITGFMGCPGNVGGNVVINVVPAPPAPAAGTDASYCEGDVMNDLTATAGSGGTLTWYDDAGLTNIDIVGTGTVFTPLSTAGTTTYYVTETVSSCVSSANSVTITIYDQGSIDAGKDTTICLRESTQLQASGGTDYQWYPDEGLSDSEIAEPIATPSQTTTYYVQVSINDNCVFEDSVIVTVRNLKDCWEIYNTFSPNGDGKNDTWIIDGIQLYEINSVTIFNRWKDVVNEFVNYDNETVVWNGTNKSSDDLPDGTYFYIIDTRDEQFTGWVQIAR